ncbi:MAG: hypothetical protein GTO02_08100, partial [Candidatus Dadabacteria bacterium]|nr:hypothetical protein [Candidatus Dadabacteria bacterium]NIQ14353.1 hypothetical protein [Candidatus Dadabacteria bacterium]
NWLKPGEIPSIVSSKVLILESNLIVTSNILDQFIKADYEEEFDQTLVLFDKSPDSLLEIDNVTKAATKHFSGGGKTLGAFIVNSKEINQIVSELELNKWLDAQINDRKIKAVPIEDGYWYRLLNNKQSIKEAEKIIFSNVGKTATGWIARNINGRISLPLSKLLIKTPLTPNMVSVLINVIGVLCGPLYALGHPVLGALFMQIATVLDRCDGEVARIKLMETKKGQWVDTISDQFTVLSFLLGVPIGYYFQTKSMIPLVFGAYNVLIFVFFVIWSFYFLVKYTNSGSLVAYFEIDKHVKKSELSVIRKIIAYLRPLGRRNVYSMALLFIAIIGGYKFLLGITTLTLTLFFLHQIEDLIRISSGKKKIESSEDIAYE